ncbi:pyruvate dehydrogenase phosphatase regulatory mitochondrial [Limosa lapponica baueri]|uniref:Pyruvate dehydrogenase phosphatase regulatory mitochondrial n=1 Tax=Limosa lapponica baueri TaxID=1758121 RepID=A0A2I0TC97_LIMLA|nr:pyruvate dehydrogenase phosphatase regulatory mitochondrial [Limosa lapponica baueri]
MADYSNKLYQQLEQETGVNTGYTKTGSISLAQTQDRLISLKRIASSLNVMGIPCEIITPKQVARLHPLINIHDLVGAMYVPEDALVSSANVSLALATAASRNAIVDPDGRIYIRNWQGGILSGGFEKNPKPLFTEGRNQLEIQNLQEDWDHFALMCDLKVPRWDFQTGRQLRTSPLYDRLDAQGARWMEKHGFERVNFFMISPTDQQVHCWAWLKNRLPDDSNLTMEDVTWKYTALNLIGPRAVDVLSELSYAPMTPEHFPSLFCKEMSVGYANGIRVMSITHTGEPGFMLYIPIEYALHVYNEVMNMGQKYGIRNAGYYALRSLRIEKFFAFWGQDLDAFTTPMECGREFQVKLEKLNVEHQ